MRCNYDFVDLRGMTYDAYVRVFGLVMVYFVLVRLLYYLTHATHYTPKILHFQAFYHNMLIFQAFLTQYIDFGRYVI